MNYITTTELRTRSTELIGALRRGTSVKLIHRSKVVGEFKPQTDQSKLFDANRVKKIVKKLNLKTYSYAQREKIYRDHLMNKYGKGIS